MFKYWAYILIGEDKTGKTTFQRNLIKNLCDRQVQRLRTNTVFQIQHPNVTKAYETIFTMNRSFQEQIQLYKSISNYFQVYFTEADICILSSHTKGRSKRDIINMIDNLHERAYNVSAVFFENGYNSECREISKLNFDERLWIENKKLSDTAEIAKQLEKLAVEFSSFLVNRSHQS